MHDIDHRYSHEHMSLIAVVDVTEDRERGGENVARPTSMLPDNRQVGECNLGFMHRWAWARVSSSVRGDQVRRHQLADLHVAGHSTSASSVACCPVEAEKSIEPRRREAREIEHKLLYIELCALCVFAVHLSFVACEPQPVTNLLHEGGLVLTRTKECVSLL